MTTGRIAAAPRAAMLGLLSGAACAMRPDGQMALEIMMMGRATPDYESRPSNLGLGSCARYEDRLPGAALGDTSHSTVMALHFDEETAEGANRRQWIFNLGQEASAAEHWLFSINGGRERVDFGCWGSQAFDSGKINRAEVHLAETIATTYDTESGDYRLYINGEFEASVVLDFQSQGGFNITTDQMLIGKRPGSRESTGEDSFHGCVKGVDFFRHALSAEEVKLASERLVGSVEEQPEQPAAQPEAPNEEAPSEEAPSEEAPGYSGAPSAEAPSEEVPRTPEEEPEAPPATEAPATETLATEPPVEEASATEPPPMESPEAPPAAELRAAEVLATEPPAEEAPATEPPPMESPEVTGNKFKVKLMHVIFASLAIVFAVIGGGVVRHLVQGSPPAGSEADSA